MPKGSICNQVQPNATDIDNDTENETVTDIMIMIMLLIMKMKIRLRQQLRCNPCLKIKAPLNRAPKVLRKNYIFFIWFELFYYKVM